MAFSIVFYVNDSEPNKLNKSLREVITVTGSLRENASVINPDIMVYSTITNIVGSNYVYIADFGRYYYITDIVSITNTLVRVKLKVDVLMSFKNDILSNRGIIQKSENNWNLYLNDGSLRTYQYKNVETKKFPNGFPTGTDLVMAIAGKSNLD